MNMLKFLLAIVTTTLFASCYRIPNDDDFSVVPTTNNPAVTCERPASIMDGVGTRY